MPDGAFYLWMRTPIDDREFTRRLYAECNVMVLPGSFLARDAAGESYHVVTVTGDGAMTGGLAYEGLNNAGSSGRDILVILNDNEMSISPNVGAISKYLTSITSSKYYNRLKDDKGTVKQAHESVKLDHLAKGQWWWD